MKKVVLALVLLALLVAVSYYKAVTQKERTQIAYDHGKEESAYQVQEYTKRFDSLAYSTKREELEAAESLWVRELAYRKAYDSMGKVIELKKRGTDSLRTELEQVRSLDKTTKATEGPSERKASKHEQILSYYKKRYRALPKDLSPYEKRVALAEIRDETAQKFSIPLWELDKIREENKLDY